MKFLYLPLVFYIYAFSVPVKLLNLSLERSNPCQFKVTPKSFKDWATGINLQQTTQTEMIRLMGLYDEYKAKHAKDTEEYEDGFTLRTAPYSATYQNLVSDEDLPNSPAYFVREGVYFYSLPCDSGHVLIRDQEGDSFRLMRRLTNKELDQLRDKGSITISGSLQQFLAEKSKSYGPVIRLEKALEQDKKSRFVDACVGTEDTFFGVMAQAEASEYDSNLGSICSESEDEDDEFGPGWKGWAWRALWSVFKP